MARNDDLTARIARIRNAGEWASGFEADQSIRKEDMRNRLGVSWPTLFDWCNTIVGLKGVVRGGNGIAWEFFPAEFVPSLLEHFVGLDGQQRSANASIAARIGIGLDDSETGASLADTGKMITLTLQVQAAKESQGAFVPAHRLVEFLDGYNQTAVEGILGVKAELDPTGLLPPEIILGIDEYLRTVALRVHDQCNRFIEEFDARPKQAGAG